MRRVYFWGRIVVGVYLILFTGYQVINAISGGMDAQFATIYLLGVIALVTVIRWLENR